MLWRIITAAIVGFWAVMTGLLLRDTYFPDSSKFTEVPPRVVLDLFLKQAAAFNNTLHLYHHQEKIGQATFQIRKLMEDAVPPVYDVMMIGSVNRAADPTAPAESTWRLAAELVDARQPRKMHFQASFPGKDTNLDAAWQEGGALPVVELRQSGKVVLDAQSMQALMALQGAGGADPLTSLLQRTGAGGGSGAMQIIAREGTMDLAGRQRRCHILTLRLMQVHEMRVFFTELGELARVELPDGYRLLDPMIHGLEPGLQAPD